MPKGDPMKYILIWYILQASGSAIASGGMTSGSAEFNDQKSCELAAEQIKSWNDKAKTACMEKGE
jgi:hypothetical protein